MDPECHSERGAKGMKKEPRVVGLSNAFGRAESNKVSSPSPARRGFRDLGEKELEKQENLGLVAQEGTVRGVRQKDRQGLPAGSANFPPRRKGFGVAADASASLEQKKTHDSEKIVGIGSRPDRHILVGGKGKENHPQRRSSMTGSSSVSRRQPLALWAVGMAIRVGVGGGGGG